MNSILMIFALCLVCVMCQGSKGYYQSNAINPYQNSYPYPSSYNPSSYNPSYYNPYSYNPSPYYPSYNPSTYYPSYPSSSYPNYPSYPSYPSYQPYPGSSNVGSGYPGYANPNPSYPGAYNQGTNYGTSNGGYYRPLGSTSATPSSSYQYPRY